MHQDHGNSPATCKSAIDNGFTTVMMDGSLKDDGKTPADFDYNVTVTQRSVELAHAKGVSVEGELGCLGSLEPGHGEKEDGHGAEGVLIARPAAHRSRRGRALRRRDGRRRAGRRHRHQPRRVQVHRASPTGEVLAMDRIEEIHRRLPNCHLVMHGSSSVPQDLQDIINKYGGKLKQTWGVPVEEIQRGIKHGVRKINVDTDNRLAITGAIRKVFAETPEKFDPRDYLKPARDAMKKVCVARMTAFGQAGRGPQDQARLARQVRQLLRDGVVLAESVPFRLGKRGLTPSANAWYNYNMSTATRVTTADELLQLPDDGFGMT